MFLIRFFAASFLFLIILTSCSNEPESNPVLTVYKGTIKGFVYDATTNAPIYYAKISTLPPTKETYTGADGEFILSDIMAGDYIVDAHKDGYDNDTTFVTIQHKDTVNTSFTLRDFSIYLDYYPLEIGDYWEYYQGSTPVYSIEIVSDTILNNKHYFVSVFKSLPGGSYTETRFERIDSYNALVYRYFPYYEVEMIIDSLPAKTEQKFSSNMFTSPYITDYLYCYRLEEENIFGEMRLVRSLRVYKGLWPIYKIVMGIGLYQFEFHRVGAYTCKYARINGIEYGEKP